MPIYTYQVIQSDGSDGEIFEVEQRMSDAALKRHPDTDQPVRRIIVNPPNIGGMGTETGKDITSEAHLTKNGFTRYEKSGDGTYTKTAGTGPSTIGG